MTSIMIIAGEPSGDFLGGQLARAIHAMRPDIMLNGIGGPHMAAEGIESLFPYEDLAVMGIAEVVPALPKILGRIRETVRTIVEQKPDIVVTIDAPDFCLRVVAAVRKEMAAPPKFIHYVAPTVWAWREGRAEKMASTVDGLICLFDFEPPYFEKHGLNSVAVGHPLIEGGAMDASAARFGDEYGVATDERVIGLLFGSRRGEIWRVGAVLRDAAFALAAKFDRPPFLVVPTLPHLKQDVFDLLREYEGPLHVLTNPEYKYDAFASFDIALAVSGTVGLELSAMGVPHVIAYRMNPVTAEIVKRAVKVKYAHLANIMLDREVVPEFIQERCRSDLIAEAAWTLYQNPAAQKAAFAELRARLGVGESPSGKAAAFVLGYLS